MNFFYNFIRNNIFGMGASSTRYMSSSDLSDSEEDPSNDTDSSPDSESYLTPNQETDAALRSHVSLPTAQHVLNMSKLKQIEENLDDEDIVALSYLLSDEKNIYTIFERLMLMISGGSRNILSEWANSHKEMNWQNNLVEALCTIKNYNILKELGYDKSNVHDHYLPNATSSIHISKLRKAAYLICDNMDPQTMKIFLTHVNKNFATRNIPFEEIKTDLLEMYLLKWEIGKQLDWYEIKHIFKIMNEEQLYNILDSVLPKPSQPQLKEIPDVNETERPSTSFQIPENPQSLKQAVLNHGNHSRTRKQSSGTSIDNNVRRDHIPHENLYLPFEHNLQSSIKDNAAERLSHDKVYPVDEENPGLVLIINQEHFYREIDGKFESLLSESGLEDRKGSDKDRDRLKDVFTKFGFKVYVENGLRHDDMLESIQKISNKVTNESSLFICIMSHGEKGVVYGSNSCKVKVSQIQKIMGACKNEHLAGKPKVLILQSCQGAQCQNLNGSDDESENNSLATDGPKSLFRDMYTFWATIPGYAAIRNKRTGSWFIQAICKKMIELGNTFHFADICTRAACEVTQQEWKDNENDKIQVMTPKMESTLLFPFYLPTLKGK